MIISGSTNSLSAYSNNFQSVAFRNYSYALFWVCLSLAKWHLSLSHDLTQAGAARLQGYHLPSPVNLTIVMALASGALLQLESAQTMDHDEEEWYLQRSGV